MTRAEAKRRVCAGVSRLLDNHSNEWILTDERGRDLSDADLRRMSDAVKELCNELRERGKGRKA